MGAPSQFQAFKKLVKNVFVIGKFLFKNARFEVNKNTILNKFRNKVNILSTAVVACVGNLQLLTENRNFLPRFLFHATTYTAVLRRNSR